MMKAHTTQGPIHQQRRRPSPICAMDVAFWNDRYASDGYVYGEAANGFLAELTLHIPPGRVLCLAVYRVGAKRLCSVNDCRPLPNGNAGRPPALRGPTLKTTPNANARSSNSIPRLKPQNFRLWALLTRIFGAFMICTAWSGNGWPRDNHSGCRRPGLAPSSGDIRLVLSGSNA
jgi:hypothetical protein